MDVIFGDYDAQDLGGFSLILCQVTQALQYLHSKSIFHRDLKPSNVYISIADNTGANSPGPVMKLANFGISKFHTGQDPLPLWKLAGSKDWMAPEIYDVSKFTKEMDVFSLGLLFGISLSGRHPFGHLSSNEIAANIRMKNPMSLTVEKLKLVGPVALRVYQLIGSMLDVDPSKRPTLQVVLEHSFFISKSIRKKKEHLVQTGIVSRLILFKFHQ